MKLLIIDDEKPVRDCIKLLIPKSTYKISEIYEAEDGLEAVQLIRQYSPDLIFTDICMPISDGLELMDWIVEIVFLLLLLRSVDTQIMNTSEIFS